MTAKRLLDEAETALADAGVASPRVDAELLLAHVTGMPRSLLVVAARPNELQRRIFLEMVEARARRVPLQHLTGTTAFRFVDLEVGPGVFVPRPETEVLAGWAIDQARGLVAQSFNRQWEPRVVDLCTGSGAIALAIVQEVPDARVHAVELDEVAFGWAQRNLSGSGVDLRLGDAADAFADLDRRGRRRGGEPALHSARRLGERRP